MHRLHCHFNISSEPLVGGWAEPLNQELANNPVWCDNGKFKSSLDFYNGFSLRHAGVMALELDAQFLKFIELTNGRGNLKHVDFHLYDNFRWPVARAMRMVIDKYNIRSARFSGVDRLFIASPQSKFRQTIALLIAKNKKVETYKSSRINFFLHKPDLLKYNVIELYCHPDYVEGRLIDNSIPVFGNIKESMADHVAMIKQQFPCELISWEDICN